MGTLKNYSAPTPPFWRKMGDYILLVCGFVGTSMPFWDLDPKTKVIVGAVISFVGMTAKFWTSTKTFPEGQGPEQSNETNQG